MFSQFGSGRKTSEQWSVGTGNVQDQYGTGQSNPYGRQAAVRPNNQPGIESTVKNILDTLNRYKTAASSQPLIVEHQAQGIVASHPRAVSSQFLLPDAQVGGQYGSAPRPCDNPNTQQQQGETTYWRFCELCNIRFTNIEHYEAHCTGELHKRNVKMSSRGAAMHNQKSAVPPREVASRQESHPAVRYQPAGVSLSTPQPRPALTPARLLPRTPYQQTRMPVMLTPARSQSRQLIGPANPGIPAVHIMEQPRHACAVCEDGEVFETRAHWLAHIESRTHCENLLRAFYRLGWQKYQQQYNSVPFAPKLDAQCSQEEREDMEVLMRIRSGLLNNFMCKLCVTKLSTKNNWTEHVTGKKHNRRCVETMNVLGREPYLEQYGDVPQPNREKIQQTLQLIQEEAEKEVLAKKQNARLENAFTYCKACEEHIATQSDWLTHLESVKHCKTLLSFFYTLGAARYGEKYGSIPFGGFLDSQCQQEDRVDVETLMRMRSAVLNSFKCKLCATKCTVRKNWIEHVTGKKHNRKCLETLYSMGLDTYAKQFGDIPIPHGDRLLETLASILRESGESTEAKFLVESVYKILVEPDAVLAPQSQQQSNKQMPATQPQIRTQGHPTFDAHYSPASQVPTSQIPPTGLVQSVTGAAMLQGQALQYLQQAVALQVVPQNVIVPQQRLATSQKITTTQQLTAGQQLSADQQLSVNQQQTEGQQPSTSAQDTRAPPGGQPASRSRIPASISVPPSTNAEFLRNQLQKQLLGIPATSEAEVYDYGHSRNGKPEEQDIKESRADRLPFRSGDKLSPLRYEGESVRSDDRYKSHDSRHASDHQNLDSGYRSDDQHLDPGHRHESRGERPEYRQEKYGAVSRIEGQPGSSVQRKNPDYDPEWDAANYKREDNDINLPQTSLERAGETPPCVQNNMEEEIGRGEKRSVPLTGSKSSLSETTDSAVQYGVSKLRADLERESPRRDQRGESYRQHERDRSLSPRRRGIDRDIVHDRRSRSRDTGSARRYRSRSRDLHRDDRRERVSRERQDDHRVHVSGERRNDRRNDLSRERRDDASRDRRGRHERESSRDTDRRHSDRHGIGRDRHVDSPRQRNYVIRDEGRDRGRRRSHDERRETSSRDERRRERTPSWHAGDTRRSKDHLYRGGETREETRRERDGRYNEQRDVREQSPLSHASDKHSRCERRSRDRYSPHRARDGRGKEERFRQIKTERQDWRTTEQHGRDQDTRNESRYRDERERPGEAHRDVTDDRYSYEDDSKENPFTERERYDERPSKERTSETKLYDETHETFRGEAAVRGRYAQKHGYELDSESRERRYRHGSNDRYEQSGRYEQKHKFEDERRYEREYSYAHTERDKDERDNAHRDRYELSERYEDRERRSYDIEHVMDKDYREKVDSDGHNERHEGRASPHHRYSGDRPKDLREVLRERQSGRSTEDLRHKIEHQRSDVGSYAADDRHVVMDIEDDLDPIVVEVEPSDAESRRVMVPTGDEDLRMQLRRRWSMDESCDLEREPRDFEHQPHDLEREPRDFEVDSRGFESKPRDFESEPRDFDSRDFNYGSRDPYWEDEQRWDRDGHTREGSEREYRDEARYSPRYEESDFGYRAPRDLHYDRGRTRPYHGHRGERYRYDNRDVTRRRRNDEAGFGEAEKRAKGGLLEREVQEGYIPGARDHKEIRPERDAYSAKKPRLEEEDEEEDEHIDTFCRTIQQFIIMLYNPEARLDDRAGSDAPETSEQEAEMARQLCDMTGVKDTAMAARAVKILAMLDPTVIGALRHLDSDLVQELEAGNHRAVTRLASFEDMLEGVENGRISVSSLSQTLGQYGFKYNHRWRSRGGSRGRGRGYRARGGGYRGRGRARGWGRGRP